MNKSYVVMIGKNYPERDNQSEELASHMSLIEGSPKVFVSPDPEDIYKLLENTLNSLIIVGDIPKNLNSGLRKLFSGFTHVILDKYIFQNHPLGISITDRNIKNLIKNLYKDLMPGRVIVNNQLMKQDFETAFSALGLSVDVEVAPIPMSMHILKRFAQLGENEGDINEMLYDSGFPSRLKNGIRKIVFECPYECDFEKELKGHIIALLNYRSLGAGYLLSENRIKDFISDLSSGNFSALRFATKSMLKGFSLGRPVLSISDNNRYSYSINARWKPNSKLTAAIGMGLPLITLPEQSIHEFADIYDYPIFEYTSVKELHDCYEEVVESDEVLKERIIGVRKRAMDMTSNNFLNAFNFCVKK